MVVIVDYGMGNVGSLVKVLNSLKVNNKVATKKSELKNASKIILPGVGNFSKAMQNIKSRDYFDEIISLVKKDKIPILGICLGMQLLSSFSEEGKSKGLNFFQSKVIKFKIDDVLRFKIPHIGWNSIINMKNSILLKNIDSNEKFYFLHSYHYENDNNDLISGYSNYEYNFPSIIENDNIYGVQFHPEKSYNAGKNLIENFIKYS
tara:strand:- start:14659 stop:15273 length:615 start_codon:yes stop_codon:yes gene_type:complete